MNELLTKVLEAHGGLERWRTYNKVEATIVSGGGFFALKGVLQDANPRHALWRAGSTHHVHARADNDREARRHPSRLIQLDRRV